MNKVCALIAQAQVHSAKGAIGVAHVSLGIHQTQNRTPCEHGLAVIC